MRRYEPDQIEPKWVERWEAEGLYAAVDEDDGRPRFYALDMFSYPSGDLHMGHMEAFSGGDAIALTRPTIRSQPLSGDIGRSSKQARGHSGKFGHSLRINSLPRVALF